MNNTKLLVGLGLGAAALYFIFKPKTTMASTKSEPTDKGGFDLKKEKEEPLDDVEEAPVLEDSGIACNTRDPKSGCYRPDLFPLEELMYGGGIAGGLKKPQLEEVLINAQVSSAPSSEFSGGFKNYVSSDMMFGLHPFFNNADGGFKNYVSSSFFNTQKQKLNY